MRRTRHQRETAWVGLAVGFTLSITSTEAGLTKVLDRKFPIGTYCPAESRAAAGGDLSFVAPAATVRITFSGINKTTTDQWNAFHVDNVSVVLKSVFDAHLLSPSPGFELCYDTTPPPGQTTGGVLNVPSYDFNAAGSTELSLDLFTSAITGWTGQNAYFDSAVRAPTVPATGGGVTGGSLGLGLASDGQIAVSASRTVTGLTAGQVYVVSFWWFAQETSPLTLTIDVPCPDQDGDGFVVCGACDPIAGQTCGDCNDANPHCGAVCADQDADGWCVTTDCDDTVATCTNNCAADTDTDAIPDCRDGCLDPDRDGYGVAGGAPNNCLGPDCNASNPWCNVSCVDADGDGHCAPGDCQDNNPKVANGLAEVGDALDQNCPGEEGYGIIDEISGNSGFSAPGGGTPFSWIGQVGALSYMAVRSSSALLAPTCVSTTTGLLSWNDAATPSPGGAFYYLVRSQMPNKGSWGQRSNGVERAVICGAEADCDNGVDDDADAATDCADPDCLGTAACRAQTFSFTDTVNDDIADGAFAGFLQSATAGPNDYIFFEIVEGSTRTVSWCSINAAFYRTQYLTLASTLGTVISGNWNKWSKSPSTGNVWQGPTTVSNLNTYGDDCFGFQSWCSEQFSFEPQNCIFPNRDNDCEVYDLTTGWCGVSLAETWRLTIKIGSTRALACGF